MKKTTIACVVCAVLALGSIASAYVGKWGTHTNNSTCNLEPTKSDCRRCCLHFAGGNPSHPSYAPCELLCRNLPGPFELPNDDDGA